jgi:hypothetical protein
MIEVQKHADGTTTLSVRLSDAEVARLVRQLTDPRAPESVSPAKARLIRYRMG